MYTQPYVRILNLYTLFTFILLYILSCYILNILRHPNVLKCVYVCEYVQSTLIHTLSHIDIHSVFICIDIFDNYAAFSQNYIYIFDMILSTNVEGSLVLVELLISSVMQWIFVVINTCTFAYKITVSAILECVRGNLLKFLTFLFM